MNAQEAWEKFVADNLNASIDGKSVFLAGFEAGTSSLPQATPQPILGAIGTIRYTSSSRNSGGTNSVAAPKGD